MARGKMIGVLVIGKMATFWSVVKVSVFDRMISGQYLVEWPVVIWAPKPGSHTLVYWSDNDKDVLRTRDS